MSLMITIVISLSETYINSRILRAVLNVFATALALILSWRLYLALNLSPVLYFDIGQPVETGLLILVTSVLMGSFLYMGVGLESSDTPVDA